MLNSEPNKETGEFIATDPRNFLEPNILLPSEIARLVLGYLRENGLPSSSATFLQESQDLDEYRRVSDCGKNISTSVGGLTLVDMLEEYCTLKLQRLVSDDPRQKRITDTWERFEKLMSMQRLVANQLKCFAYLEVNKQPLGNKSSRVQGSRSRNANSELRRRRALKTPNLAPKATSGDHHPTSYSTNPFGHATPTLVPINSPAVPLTINTYPEKNPEALPSCSTLEEVITKTIGSPPRESPSNEADAKKSVRRSPRRKLQTPRKGKATVNHGAQSSFVGDVGLSAQEFEDWLAKLETTDFPNKIAQIANEAIMGKDSVSMSAVMENSSKIMPDSLVRNRNSSESERVLDDLINQSKPITTDILDGLVSWMEKSEECGSLLSMFNCSSNVLSGDLNQTFQVNSMQKEPSKVLVATNSQILPDGTLNVDEAAKEHLSKVASVSVDNAVAPSPIDAAAPVPFDTTSSFSISETPSKRTATGDCYSSITIDFGNLLKPPPTSSEDLPISSSVDPAVQRNLTERYILPKPCPDVKVYSSAEDKICHEPTSNNKTIVEAGPPKTFQKNRQRKQNIVVTEEKVEIVTTNIETPVKLTSAPGLESRDGPQEVALSELNPLTRSKWKNSNEETNQTDLAAKKSSHIRKFHGESTQGKSISAYVDSAPEESGRGESNSEQSTKSLSTLTSSESNNNEKTKLAINTRLLETLPEKSQMIESKDSSSGAPENKSFLTNSDSFRKKLNSIDLVTASSFLSGRKSLKKKKTKTRATVLDPDLKTKSVTEDSEETIEQVQFGAISRPKVEFEHSETNQPHSVVLDESTAHSFSSLDTTQMFETPLVVPSPCQRGLSAENTLLKTVSETVCKDSGNVSSADTENRCGYNELSLVDHQRPLVNVKIKNEITENVPTHSRIDEKPNCSDLPSGNLYERLQVIDILKASDILSRQGDRKKSKKNKNNKSDALDKNKADSINKTVSTSKPTEESSSTQQLNSEANPSHPKILEACTTNLKLEETPHASPENLNIDETLDAHAENKALAKSLAKFPNVDLAKKYASIVKPKKKKSKIVVTPENKCPTFSSDLTPTSRSVEFQNHSTPTTGSALTSSSASSIGNAVLSYVSPIESPVSSHREDSPIATPLDVKDDFAGSTPFVPSTLAAQRCPPTSSQPQINSYPSSRTDAESPRDVADPPASEEIGRRAKLFKTPLKRQKNLQRNEQTLRYLDLSPSQAIRTVSSVKASPSMAASSQSPTSYPPQVRALKPQTSPGRRKLDEIFQCSSGSSLTSQSPQERCVSLDQASVIPTDVPVADKTKSWKRKKSGKIVVDGRLDEKVIAKRLKRIKDFSLLAESLSNDGEIK